MISDTPRITPRPFGAWDRERTDPSRGCTPRSRIKGTGSKTLSEAIMQMMQLSVHALLEKIEVIQERLDRRSIIVPIQSLEPSAIEITQPILAVVQEEDGVYIASFLDANINASGETQLEAVEMLKDLIASSFRLLVNKELILGEGPQKKLAVLRQFVRVR